MKPYDVTALGELVRALTAEGIESEIVQIGDKLIKRSIVFFLLGQHRGICAEQARRQHNRYEHQGKHFLEHLFSSFRSDTAEVYLYYNLSKNKSKDSNFFLTRSAFQRARFVL